MKIQGNQNNMVVSYDIRHGEWKNEQTVLSVDQLSVIFCVDGSVALKSKDGRLELAEDGAFVMVRPGWYDAKADLSVNTKTPVFKNQVACCYTVTQKTNNRTGYILSFKEKEIADD